MKKLLLSITILLSIFSFSYTTNAVSVTVTEKIPWLWCTEVWNQYKCDVWQWMDWVYKTMWGIIKYATLLAAMWWVLFIVINWIHLSMWWIDSWAKESAKKRITKTIFWLIILLLSWVILHIIAPWVYK